MQKETDSGERILLEIDGAPISPGETPQQVVQKKCAEALKFGGVAIVLTFIGFKAFDSSDFSSAAGHQMGFPDLALGFGFMILIFAAMVPGCIQTYLNIARRQIETEKYYGWFCWSKQSRPFTDFSHIVVRHLCIPGGEGPDTYTGSVGLKPKDGKAVFWVKNFPATPDEFPTEAQEFARKLEGMTGLPGSGGLESSHSNNP